MSDRRIAYFSMEIGLEPTMPTYAGGLGILAADVIRAAADLGLPIAAVTLIHRKGYFFQRLDRDGRQYEEPSEWVIEDFLTELPQRVRVTIERVLKICRSFEEADQEDLDQWLELTGDERLRIGEEMRAELAGPDEPGLRRVLRVAEREEG